VIKYIYLVCVITDTLSAADNADCIIPICQYEQDRNKYSNIRRTQICEAILGGREIGRDRKISTQCYDRD